MRTPYTQEHIDQLYTLIGKALWHLQHLENIVAYFTTYKILQAKRDKGKKLRQTDLERVLGKQKGQTLGPLISTAKAHKTIPADLAKRFDLLLAERNWLIHHCVTDEYLSLRNETKRLRLFRRINTFAEEAISLQNEVQCLFEDWFTELGYDLSKAYDVAEDLLKNAVHS